MIIILVHGFPGFSSLELLGFTVADYFRGVAGHLDSRFRDLEIRAPGLGFTDPPDARADKLSATIPNQGERVHIIAHSVGGVDARFVASPRGLNRGARIATIATISSPHRGSQIANWFAEPTAELADIIAPIKGFAQSVAGLTTKEMEVFNRTHPRVNGVNYLYFAGKTTFDDLFHRGSFFTPFFKHIESAEGPNDGWVSVTSSSPPGEPAPEILDLTDHGQQVGWDIRVIAPIPTDRHLAFYERLAERLGAKRR